MPQAISTTEIPTPRGAWSLRWLTVALPPFSNGVEFVFSAEFHYRSVYRVSQKSQTNLKSCIFRVVLGKECRIGYQVKAYSKIFCLSEDPPHGVT